MDAEFTAHISGESTDGIGVIRGGESDDIAYARDRDEANIRWLLAAVLHHESADDAPVVVDDDE